MLLIFETTEIKNNSKKHQFFQQKQQHKNENTLLTDKH